MNEVNYRYGDLVVAFGLLSEETSAPKVYRARVLGRAGPEGYGTTEAEAVADLLRARRAPGAPDAAPPLTEAQFIEGTGLDDEGARS